MNNKYDETIEILANMSKVKMAMNAHKGDIEKCDPMHIYNMLLEEVNEVGEAIGEENLMHIIEEAADAMNFLVALTHQQIEKYRTRKND